MMVMERQLKEFAMLVQEAESNTGLGIGENFFRRIFVKDNEPGEVGRAA